jgi:hypothetical protein
MKTIMKYGAIYIKEGGKVMELVSKERLKKLMENKDIMEKLNELSMNYVYMMTSEIGKMDLEDEDKLIAEIIVMEKINDATTKDLNEMVKIAELISDQKTFKAKETIMGRIMRLPLSTADEIAKGIETEGWEIKIRKNKHGNKEE